VVWYQSRHLSKTWGWHRSYVQLPFLHESFGRSLSDQCGLYVLFSFNEPAVHAGFWFEPRKVEHFAERAEAIAAWMRKLDPGFGISLATPLLGAPAPLDRELLTADWLREGLSASAFHRIERTWEPEALTSSAPALETLEELALSLSADGSLLEALEADGTPDRAQAANRPSED
jgi:hypothetical protein